jgi:hypothetical protein
MVCQSMAPGQVAGAKGTAKQSQTNNQQEVQKAIAQ